MTVLLAASTGGHLAQLHLMREEIAAGQPVVWATFRSPQSESLLEGETVVWLDYIPPRGYREIVRNLPECRRALKGHAITEVVSTGSGIALAVFPVARMMGVRCTYIESAARCDGPSVTGRAISLLPGVLCRSQYRSWANRRWLYRGSIFDHYAARPHAAEAPVEVRRLLVTLGTIKPYGFSRLLRRLAEVVPPDVEVMVQHGATPIEESLRRPAFRFVETMPASQLADVAIHSDVVIGHAGIGSVLMSFGAGKRPVLVVRRAEQGEHVDDHQELIGSEMAARDLAVTVEADELVWNDIVSAARATIVPVMPRQRSGGSRADQPSDLTSRP